MQQSGPVFTSDEWDATVEQVAEELTSFVMEFGTFTPEWFIEVKFHLVKYDHVGQDTRDDLCEVSIHYKTCPKCNYLYKAKRCLLWYELFKAIDWKIVERAPPCIRAAFAKKSIKTVADFLVKAGLIDLPFYKVRSAPSCGSLERWGYCNPDEYCKVMERRNTLAYNAARIRLKQSRDLK